MLFRWRWIFSSRWLTPVTPTVDISAARQIPAALLNLVFPADCRICGARLQNFSNIPVCDQCLASAEPLLADFYCRRCHTAFLNQGPLDDNGLCGLCRRDLTSFDRAYSYGEYAGNLRRSIQIFKYGGVQSLARPLGGMLAAALPLDQAFDMVVPMPLHWRRRWKRGFNQAELLAQAVSRRFRIPLENVLRRKRATPPQAGLTNAERRRNVSGAFEIKKRSSVAGKHVVLVDDVLTTGATVNAAAAALKRAGARRVTVLTLARVDRRRSAILG